MLEAEGDIKVVGEAASGEEAVEQVRILKPDVTTMDVQMPGLGGLEAIERIMARTPVPILVVTGSVCSWGSGPTGSVCRWGPGPTGRPARAQENLGFEAVRRGALDLVEKPAADDAPAREQLRSLVRRFAEVRVVRHVAGNRRGAAIAPVGSVLPRQLRSSRAPSVRTAGGPLTLIGIGASAGGPNTLVSLLSQLQPDIKAAVALVQHLPSGFVPSFADYLARSTGLPVKLVRHKARVEAGSVYLASDDRHLVATGRETLAAVQGARVAGHRPSVTTLFQSMAETLGASGVGVILTGMGDDGAVGLLSMSAAGAYTIAQDEASSVVYGMPKAAVEAGGVKAVLPLNLIPGVLNALAGLPRASSGKGALSP
jgi:two-component system chemotaxis response regulator CheB